MTELVWLLILVYDPSQFNPQYRTPDVLERSVLVYETREECLEAVDILTRGIPPPGGLRVAQYECIQGGREEGIWRPVDDPREIGEGTLHP